MTTPFAANAWVRHLATYEPGKPIEEVARELGFADVAGIVKLASNENALGPSPRALAAMTACASQMHRYPDGGAFYLAQALARRLNLEPANLVFGSGSNELIEMLAHVFLRKGLNLVMADRAFVVYRLVAAAANAEVVAVPMAGGFTHDLDAMRRAITPATRLVIDHRQPQQSHRNLRFPGGAGRVSGDGPGSCGHGARRGLH